MRTYSETELSEAMKGFVYGKSLNTLAKDFHTNHVKLTSSLKERYGDNLLQYRHDSIVLYLQHPKHNLKMASERFNIRAETLSRLLRERFKPAPTEKTHNYYKRLSFAEMEALKAPWERYIISYLREHHPTSNPEPKKTLISTKKQNSQPFEGLTKEQRTAKAREIHLRVNQNVREARLFRNSLDAQARRQYKKFYG